MITQLTSNWWKPVAMGVIAIIFGILLFVYPQAGITVFVSLFAPHAPGWDRRACHVL